jgi:N-acetylglucosamine-6-phosphate deacetylase
LGFFDLQVNGYAGFDFNTETIDETTTEAMEAVCLRLEQQGVEAILATVITDTLPVMEARFKRLLALHRTIPAMQRVVRGFHMEGPFFNPTPGYRGAHPVDAIIPGNTDAMQQLMDAAGGMLKLVTLAPEVDAGMKVTRMLADRGVVVSAGHTDATLDQLKASIDAGLSMFTHLGNGCPGIMNRHDNIVQRALSLHKDLWLCFIADGAHIPYFALKNYLQITGLEKAIIVTDCIVAADLGPGRFSFGRWDLNIGEDLVARAPDNSHLVGSTVTMPKSFSNLTTELGFSAADAQTLLEHNPKRAMGL